VHKREGGAPDQEGQSWLAHQLLYSFGVPKEKARRDAGGAFNVVLCGG